MSNITPITDAQRATLKRKHKQEDQGMMFCEFRSTVQPTFMCDDAVTVQWCGMWLCIETDGHCHT